MSGDRANPEFLSLRCKKSALMTRLGHPTTWTCAENLLTLGLRASGRD
jgi:hypothetical protein